MRFGLPLVVSLVLGLPSSPTLLSAQLETGGSASNFGSVTLAPGFSPDPRTVSVLSGGTLSVGEMELGSGCVGFATTQPDYIVNLSSEADRLRFFVEGDGDTGLVVHGPAGSWACNDDHTGLDPLVTVQGALAGQYDVWVTSYSGEDHVPSTLHVTELDLQPGSSSTSTANDLAIGGDAANFGQVTLAPGFSPDPYSVSIRSGGTLDIGAMELGPGCLGSGTFQPDFILQYAGDGDMLRLYVDGNGDTGLVVNAPDGSWHCNDDSYDGLDPTVTFQGAESGQYDVWVTSYSEGENVDGTLSITELEDRHPGG